LFKRNKFLSRFIFWFIGKGCIMAYGTVNADVISTSVANTSLGAGNATRFKNRIINGDMRIDQRNAGASVTLPDGASAYSFVTDRWAGARASTATSTGQQSTTAPTGFINSLLITNGTGITVGSTGQGYIIQVIEGLNIADLGWGTADAKTVTLSFWVRSSITGTHSGALSNSAVNRSYPFTYTISSANTWTQISLTIPGDTTGTWLTTNGRGIFVIFNNGSGSTYLGTAGSWAGANYYGATGSVALNSVTGSTWYVTGVQLEVGSSATGFEYVDFGTQLAMCSRYYQTTYNIGVAPGSVSSLGPISRTLDYAQPYFTLMWNMPVKMRTTPTTTYYSPTTGASGKAVYTPGSVDFSVINYGYDGMQNVSLISNAVTVSASYGVTAHFTASAEL
jgi:hypothetical protein